MSRLDKLNKELDEAEDRLRAFVHMSVMRDEEYYNTSTFKMLKQHVDELRRAVEYEAKIEAAHTYEQEKYVDSMQKRQTGRVTAWLHRLPQFPVKYAVLNIRNFFGGYTAEDPFQWTLTNVNNFEYTRLQARGDGEPQHWTRDEILFAPGTAKKYPYNWLVVHTSPHTSGGYERNYLILHRISYQLPKYNPY